MKKQIPNALSVLRIAGAIALFIMPVFTVPFFIVYGVCVLFDFADGFLADKFNAKSQLGNVLDHTASILFVVLMTMKYMSAVDIPAWAVYTAMGIILIKCASIVFGAVRFRKAPFINTDWNKWAKLSFYLAPLWYLFAGMVFACVVILFMMLVATVEEFIINLTSKTYNPDTKTLFNFKKRLEKKKNEEK